MPQVLRCHTSSFTTQLHPIVARPRIHIGITQGPNPQIETREASHLTLADEWWYKARQAQQNLNLLRLTHENLNLLSGRGKNLGTREIAHISHHANVITILVFFPGFFDVLPGEHSHQDRMAHWTQLHTCGATS